MNHELKRIATELVLLVRECYAKSGSVFVEDVVSALREAARVQMEADCAILENFGRDKGWGYTSRSALIEAIRTAYETNQGMKGE